MIGDMKDTFDGVSGSWTKEFVARFVGNAVHDVARNLVLES